jgi:hypothetical protein
MCDHQYQICGIFMDSTIISALIGVGGALIGSWAGGAISRSAALRAAESSNRNAMDIMARQEFNKAAAAFRAALVDEMYRLEHIDMSTSINCLAVMMERTDATTVAHEKARILFEPFIDKSGLPGFRKAWGIYTNNWPQYLKDGDGYDKQDFFSHLFSFLEYAKPK